MTVRIAHLLTVTGILLGCVTPDPPLTLAERFERVALRDDAGNPVDLLKWSWPIKVGYVGDPAYRDDVIRHAELLGELASVPVRYVEYEENMLVRIVPRRELAEEANAAATRLYGRDFGSDATRGFSCMVSTRGDASRYWASVGIADDLPPSHVRGCIVQEMSQALGLSGDLDGRTDTNFTSLDNGSIDLTNYDRQLFAILYDDRLYSGMRRDEVLAILPEIVADVEAATDSDVTPQTQ